MPLKHSDIQAVSEALRELYANTDASTLPHCIVGLLHRLIPADSAVYNSFDFRTGEMQVVHDHGPDGDRYLPALEKHIEQHPLMVHVRAHWLDGAASLSDVISRRQLRNTGIYHEFLHPLGIEEQVGLLVEDRVYGVTAISLQRDGRNFSRRDKDLLTFLQPHLMQAYKNATDITRTGAQNQSSEHALNVAQVGVIRLTPALKIQWISGHAKKWLPAYFPSEQTRTADGVLPAKMEAWLRLQQQIQSLRWQVVTERGVLSVRRVIGQNGEIHLVLSEQRNDALPCELESLGLSRRESEVLHWIAQGKTNEAIGVILSTSKRTVDKQVENILRKLGVESRVGAALRADQHRRLS
jgi:DNA-binding CsgD family transcriptional regulator